MEKNGNGTTTPPDSMGVCEKIFNAITISSAFRTIRQIRNFPQDSASPSPARDTSHAAVKTIAIQSKPQAPTKSSEAAQRVIQVPIKFEASHVYLQKMSKTTTVNAPAQEEPKPKEDLAHKKVIGTDHSHEAKEEKPKYYSKPESPVKGDAENIEGNKKKHTEVDDTFSDYIHRVKNKFKSTPSNLGTGNNISFKRG